jgi:multidrug efflux pump subunit AcrA (membrane-fusion protein)
MKDFKPEEAPVTKFTRNSKLMPLSRETAPEKSDTVIPFPEEPDYAVLEPVSPTQFIPPIRRWVGIGGIIMVSSFAAAIGLSTILKYKVTVQAPAVVRPVGELRLVQSTLQGSVLSIAVRENQVVKKGDPIATVKDLRLENKLQTKLNQLAGDSRKAQQQLQANQSIDLWDRIRTQSRPAGLSRQADYDQSRS